MKNIKTIELTADMFGLPAGATLTRLNPESDFVYSEERIGDNFNYKQTVTLSPSAVDRSFARAKEWFNERRSAKQVISELESRVEDLAYENKALTDKATAYDKLVSRIETKRTEFETKLAQLNKELDEDLIAGESIEWADEAMTVYYNLIDLLKKLTA